MAKDKAVRQVEGIEAKVAGNPTGWRVPKWLLYGGIGVAGALAAVYLGFRLATAVPEPGTEQQATTFATVTPFVPTPRPVDLQHQRQVLEDIAAIGNYEPTLAKLLTKTDWVRDVIKGGPDEFLIRIKGYVETNNYSIGAIHHGDGSETTVLVLSDDKDKRSEALAKTQQYMPQVSRLLRIEYKRPLLVIELLKGDSGLRRGSAGFQGVNTTDLEGLEHELVHAVFEFSGSMDSPLSQVPNWLTEGVPQFVDAFIYGGDYSVQIWRKNMLAMMERREYREYIGPLFEMSLKRNPGPGGFGFSQNVYDGGFLFLAEYANLVDYNNFWAAMHDIYDSRVANGAVPRRVITDVDLDNPSEEVGAIIMQQHEKLEAILEQHVPQEKMPQFKQLYQERVYGLRPAQP